MRKERSPTFEAARCSPCGTGAETGKSGERRAASDSAADGLSRAAGLRTNWPERVGREPRQIHLGFPAGVVAQDGVECSGAVQLRLRVAVVVSASLTVTVILVAHCSRCEQCLACLQGRSAVAQSQLPGRDASWLRHDPACQAYRQATGVTGPCVALPSCRSSQSPSRLGSTVHAMPDSRGQASLILVFSSGVVK